MKSIFSISFMGTALLALCSLCSCEKQPDSGSGQDELEGYQTVKVAFDRNTVLHNPMNGWVMYGSGSGDP